MLGIVAAVERNEGRRGGTYREYSLNMDLDMLLDALGETVSEVGVHESVSGRVDIQKTLSERS
jgi:cell division control protein 6